MFLIAFSVFGYVSMPYKAFFFFFSSLFLFPETIPSGACYMLMRLDDERLSPGRQAKRKCRCRDFITIWKFIFSCLLHTNKPDAQMVCCCFFFLVSLMEIFHMRQLLLGDELKMNTITVIVLLRKKVLFF